MRALHVIFCTLLLLFPALARANQEQRKPSSFPGMPLELNRESGTGYDPYGWSRKNNLSYVMGMQGEGFTAGVRYGYMFVPGNEISVAVLPNSAGVAGNMMYQLQKRAGGLFLGAASGIHYGRHVQ